MQPFNCMYLCKAQQWFNLLCGSRGAPLGNEERQAVVQPPTASSRLKGAATPESDSQNPHTGPFD